MVGEPSPSCLCWRVGLEEMWSLVCTLSKHGLNCTFLSGWLCSSLLGVCSAGLASLGSCWPHTSGQLGQGSGMTHSGLNPAREKSFCYPLPEALRVFEGLGKATRASLNLTSKSNFKGNCSQISNCLLVLVLKAPCIPPVAMLSSP